MVVSNTVFFIFTPTWGNDPIWQIFLKWVETTNQYVIDIYKLRFPHGVHDAFDLTHQGYEPIDGETCLIYEAVNFAQKVQEIQQLN